MKGLLVINGFLDNKRFTVLYEMLKKAFNEEGINLDIKTNIDLMTLITNDICYKDVIDLDPSQDFIIFWDKDILLGKCLEKIGFRLFNKVDAIAICDDKALTAITLSNNNIPMPKTIISPFTFNNIPYNEFSFIDKIINELKLPIIIKENKGSFGAQVYLAHTKNEVIDIINKVGTKPIIFQEFVKNSMSTDVRIEVVGHKALKAVKRVNEKDFRSNVLAGGRMEKFDAPKEFFDLAEEVSRIIGLDFCGVDILFGENGKPLLCEVNSNCHFKTFYTITGINLASEIASYVINTLKSNKK